MKKLFITFLSFIFVLSGCAAKEVKIDRISTDYLITINVEGSKIEKIDHKRISEYDNSTLFRDLSYICGAIDEVLEPFYDIQIVSNRAVENGDVVLFEAEFSDENGDLIHSEKSAEILVGSGFLKNIEAEVIGKNSGRSFSLTPDSTEKEFFNSDDIDIINITVTDILHYDEKPETPDFLKEQNFSSFEDFYSYLFKKKTNEHDYEKNSEIKDDFIDLAVDSCEFLISSDDLKDYSKERLKVRMPAAQSLNSSSDDYCSDVLTLDEFGSFLMCTEYAEKEIKKCLAVGALSEYYGISINDEYFEFFCENNNIDASDSELTAAARYFCLETAVIEHFTHLFDHIYLD